MVIFKWIGKPGEFIPGIPPRDLTAEDLAAAGITEKDLERYGAYYQRVAPVAPKTSNKE